MITGFVALNLLSMLLVVCCSAELRAFLRTHAEIASIEDLAALKNLARRNMYAALAIILLGAASIGWMVPLVISKGLLGAVVALTVYFTGLYFANVAKALGKKARTLPASASIRAEYEAVSEAWVKKPLPNF